MILHVAPLGDLVEHELSEGCVCGPTPELVPHEDGDRWIHTHHSLDGREAHEEGRYIGLPGKPWEVFILEEP